MSAANQLTRVGAWLAAATLWLGGAPAVAAVVPLTLHQTIAMAQARSPAALAAIHRYRASYWQYVTFVADYRPSVDMDATPYSLAHTIAQQTLPNGTDAFVPRTQTNSSLGLSLNKVVSLTGGRIALRSEVARSEALVGEGGAHFFSTPVLLSYEQPLFAFNSYAWGLRIEPKRYAEARQWLIEELEGVSATAIGYFFDLLTSQSSLEDARRQKVQADTVLAVAKRRFQGGRGSEDELLQAELATLNADLSLARVQVDVAARQQQLGMYLGMEGATKLRLDSPLEVPVVKVELDTALNEARANRPEMMAFTRQLLEVDRTVAQAHASSGATTISASYGLSRTSDNVQDLYRRPRVDQQAQVVIRTPILDWGRTRARVAVAESQREVVRRQIQQQRSDFERDVFLRVSQIDIETRRLRLAARADSVAQRRYGLARARYLSAREALNTVTLAQVEMETARRGYLDALRGFWSAYWDVRRATLYDFAAAQRIVPPAVRLQ